ncbi:MAG: hypothetical protein AAFR16_04990 [Pseudomonadota bacterium]
MLETGRVERDHATALGRLRRAVDLGRIARRRSTALPHSEALEAHPILRQLQAWRGLR